MFMISSRLNDFTYCYRGVNADIMKLCISAIDNARKLKFSSYVYLPPINKIIPYRYA